MCTLYVYGVPVTYVGLCACVFVSCVGAESELRTSVEYYRPTNQNRINNDVRKGNQSRNVT